MKKIITFSLVSILLFFGCDLDSGIISPVSLDNSPVYKGGNKLKYDLIKSPEYDPAEYDTLAEDRVRSYPPGADSIFIPINLPPSEIPNLRVSKVIEGSDGGHALGVASSFLVPFTYSLHVRPGCDAACFLLTWFRYRDYRRAYYRGYYRGRSPLSRSGHGYSSR